jgi:hypothetical protein
MTFRSIATFVFATVLISRFFLSAAPAEQRADLPRGVIGMVQIVNDASVQRELDLTDKQMGEVKKVAMLLAQVRDGKAQSQAKTQLSESLSAEQLKRLKQIYWQRLGGYALLEPEVATLLKISEEQQKEFTVVQAINAAEHKKMLDFMSRARFRSAEAVEEFKAKYRTAAKQRLLAILTPDQVVVLEKLLGKAVL